MIRKKIEDFEELIKNNKYSSSFDVKALHRRFRKVKNVIHVDCFYDKDKITLTMEDAMSDTVNLYKALVERNAAISVLDWITRAHSILNTLLDFDDIDDRDALRLAQCIHTIVSSLHREHGEKLTQALAVSHHDLALCYTSCGMHAEAVNALLIAVQIERDLANKRPDDHECCFAAMNHRLGDCYEEMEKYEDTVDSIKTTIRYRKKLASKAPMLYRSPLPQAELDLGSYLYNLKRYTEAAGAEFNALTIWMDFAKVDSEAFNPKLALAQNNYADTLFSLQRYDDALRVTLATVELRRKLSHNDPEKNNSQLSSALHLLGCCFSKLGRHQEALAPVEEAVGSEGTLCVSIGAEVRR